MTAMLNVMRRPAILAALVLICIHPVPASESPEALEKKATELAQQENWKDAAAAYARLTELNPAKISHWIGLARAYRGTGEYEKSIAASEKALGIDKTSTLALAGIAITLELDGDLDRAFRYLKESAAQGMPAGALKGSPAFEGLRAHSQFAAVVKEAERVGSPCLHEDPYDDFDFWVGDWDIHIGGVKRAENLITKDMNGCIIRERYHDQSGSRGESINYYDPGTKQWKQNWVDAGGNVVRYTGGLKEEGVMHMEGTNTRPNGSTRLSRVTWTRLPDGKVHHLIEHSTDDGRTWNKAFEGTYVKSDREQQASGR